MPPEQRCQPQQHGGRPGDADGQDNGPTTQMAPMDDGSDDGHEALKGDEEQTEDGALGHDDDSAVGDETGVEVTRKGEVGGDDARDADGAYEEIGGGERRYETVGRRPKKPRAVEGDENEGVAKDARHGDHTFAGLLNYPKSIRHVRG